MQSGDCTTFTAISMTDLDGTSMFLRSGPTYIVSDLSPNVSDYTTAGLGLTVINFRSSYSVVDIIDETTNPCTI
jgi:hypothetical protein